MRVAPPRGEVMVLGRDDLARTLQPDELLGVMRTALAQLYRTPAAAPPRSMLPTSSGGLVLMPAFDGLGGVVGVKALTVTTTNPDRGLPYGQGVVLLFSVEDGRLVACVDGPYVTEVRTAATSAIATDVLARPDATVLSILGTGIQARAHALFISRVRSITEVRVAGRSLERARAAAADITARTGLPASATVSYEEAVSGSDIVCGVSHSPEPVIQGGLLAPGMHVNSVGLNREGREVDAEAVVRSVVVVESREAVLRGASAGSNDLMWPIRDGVVTPEHIRAEVGELIVRATTIRTQRDQITLFKSVGSAIEDVATAAFAVQRATEMAIGSRISM